MGSRRLLRLEEEVGLPALPPDEGGQGLSGPDVGRHQPADARGIWRREAGATLGHTKSQLALDKGLDEPGSRYRVAAVSEGLPSLRVDPMGELTGALSQPHRVLCDQPGRLLEAQAPDAGKSRPVADYAVRQGCPRPVASELPLAVGP